MLTMDSVIIREKHSCPEQSFEKNHAGVIQSIHFRIISKNTFSKNVDIVYAMRIDVSWFLCNGRLSIY